MFAPAEQLIHSRLVALCYLLDDGRVRTRSLRRVEAEECKRYLEENDPGVKRVWIRDLPR